MNAPATFDTARRMSPWEARYRAALGGPDEAWNMMWLHIQTDKIDDDSAEWFYLLANADNEEDRALAIAEIEEAFTRWATEEDHPGGTLADAMENVG